MPASSFYAGKKSSFSREAKAYLEEITGGTIAIQLEVSEDAFFKRISQNQSREIHSMERAVEIKNQLLVRAR